MPQPFRLCTSIVLTDIRGKPVAEVPGQELGDAVDRMICDHCEDVAQVGFGIDAVEFASIDQAVDRSSALSTRIGACEQPVLAPQRHTTERALGSAVVDLEPAVVTIAAELGSARAGVADRGRKLGSPRPPGASSPRASVAIPQAGGRRGFGASPTPRCRDRPGSACHPSCTG